MGSLRGLGALRAAARGGVACRRFKCSTCKVPMECACQDIATTCNMEIKERPAYLQPTSQLHSFAFLLSQSSEFPAVQT